MGLSLNRRPPLRLVNPVTGSNCYVIPQGGVCMVVDPNGMEPLEQLFQKWNTRPALVLLTHEHCDHIEGLNQLRDRYDFVVAASGRCSQGIGNPRINMSRMMEVFLYYEGGQKQMVPYEPFVCKAADLQFGDEIRFQFGELPVCIKSLPGHTPGSAVISCGEPPYGPMVFTGDYLLPDQEVITRLPGGSDEEYRKYTMPWLSGIPCGTEIFPGHGEPYCMNEEVRVFHGL